MKKTISGILAAVLLICIFSGCGNVSAPGGKLSVVTTIFPEYDWVMNILGENTQGVDVTMLLDSGVDLHSFQPTADDIISIAQCDLFIYVGGESDEWVEAVLEETGREDMLVLNLLDILSDVIREEEIKDGMEAGEDGEAGETEYDEHVWLSLKNASTVVDAIRDALIGLDAENEELYRANAEAYTEKLNELDGRYQSAVEAAQIRTVLFADRFPFRYLTDDYGLDYYAAFAGCSAESEASFETIRFLADKVDELGLSTVLTLEGSDQRIAETVVSTAGAGDIKILSMDSMQSVTAADVEEGASYLSIMENNLDVLKDALK